MKAIYPTTGSTLMSCSAIRLLEQEHNSPVPQDVQSCRALAPRLTKLPIELRQSIFDHLLDRSPNGWLHNLRFQVTNELRHKRYYCGRSLFDLPSYLDARLVGSHIRLDVSQYAAELVSRDRAFAPLAFENMTNGKLAGAVCLELSWYHFVRDVDVEMPYHEARCAFEGMDAWDTHPSDLGNSAWPFLQYVKGMLVEALKPLGERYGRVKLRAGHRGLDRKYHGEEAMQMYRDSLVGIADGLVQFGLAKVEVEWIVPYRS